MVHIMLESNSYIILTLVCDRFVLYTITAVDYDEAIRLFVDSIVPVTEHILFCGCWLEQDYINLAFDNDNIQVSSPAIPKSLLFTKFH